jgi:chlorophyllide a reductase subunit X
MTTIFDANAGRQDRHSENAPESSDADGGDIPAKPAKDTQIIAIYGKGGIGKSFTLANLSYMMA